MNQYQLQLKFSFSENKGQMSSDKLDQQQEERNSGRRSRKDQQGRDYVCGCGKSYLSYPALYTHIKTKHEGLRPEGTCKVSSVVNTKKPFGTNSYAVVPHTHSQASQDAFIIQRASSNLNTNSISNKSKQAKISSAGSSRKMKLLLNSVILNRLQHFTTAADYPLANHLHMLESQQPTFTHPNSRIVKQKVGQDIYEKFMQLVKLGKDIERQLHIGSCADNEFQIDKQYEDKNENVNVNANANEGQNFHKQQNQSQQNQLIEIRDSDEINNNQKQQQNLDLANPEVSQLIDSRLEKLSAKSQIQYVMVVYLLGAGRYVGVKYMEFYMQFCRLFRDCFVDHVQDIYEVCFKNPQQAETRQHVRQPRQARERDNPYKYYEYSYLPSSSKSKSYQSYQQSQQPSASTPHTNTYHVGSNVSHPISINLKQCKYCPIICQYFIKMYIANLTINISTTQHFKQIMQLLCIDFCGWLWRNKYTVVEVGINRRYQIRTTTHEYSYNKNNYNSRQQSSPQGKKKQKITQISHKNSPSQAMIDRNAIHQKQIITQSNNKQKKPIKQRSQQVQRDFSDNQANQQQYQNQQQEEHMNLNLHEHQEHEEHSHSHARHHQDEDSYKLGHEMGMGPRDRIGSIHQSINMSQQQQLQQSGLIEGQQVQSNEQAHNSEIARPARANGERRGYVSNGNSLDEQQIQKYINP